jgi:hypothetical protein
MTEKITSLVLLLDLYVIHLHEGRDVLKNSPPLRGGPACRQAGMKGRVIQRHVLVTTFGSVVNGHEGLVLVGIIPYSKHTSPVQPFHFFPEIDRQFPFRAVGNDNDSPAPFFPFIQPVILRVFEYPGKPEARGFKVFRQRIVGLFIMVADLFLRIEV